MPRPKRKTKAEDLARIRRNQRKSRDRKKQRVLELERRVEQLEAAATEASVQSLEHENRTLRGLLESVGFDGVSLNRYLHGPATASSSGHDLALAADSSEMQFMGLEVGPPTISGILGDEAALQPVSSTQLVLDQGMQNEFTPLSGDRFQLNLPWSLPTEQGRNESQPRATATFNAGLTITEDLAGVVQNMGGVTGSAVGLVNDETTLCSIAFHLVVQCNRAGKDVLELETKLRYGYRMPALPGEGCRVDNRTLLAVLAELV